METLPLTLPQELLVELSLQNGDGAQRPVESVPAERGLPGAFRPLYGALPPIDALQLTPEFTDCLIERSRSEGTTIHGSLCAALVLAGSEVSSDWRNAPVQILPPFILRKQIGIGEDCGLFVWAVAISVEPHAPADFWEMARAAKLSLTSQQSLVDVALGMATLGEALAPNIDACGASQILAQAVPGELLPTNLGNLPAGSTAEI